MTEVEASPIEVVSRRDVWEKIGAISPLLCGVLISAVGTYCTYTYNQQQLKILQVQTIGSFIPHLMGNEQSKKAAILALSSMTNTETASEFAQIFASSGTVSALQSMSATGSDKDKAIASQALSSALQNLAQQDNLTKLENQYEKKLVTLQDSSKKNSYTAYNMTKLAQLYIMRGQLDLAEPLLERSLSLRSKLYGTDNPELCDTLRSLAEIYFLTGRAPMAEENIKLARAIEQKLASSAGQSLADNPSFKDEIKLESAMNPASGQIDRLPVPSAKADAASKDSTHDPAEISKSTENQPAKIGAPLSGTDNQPAKTGTQLSGTDNQG